MPSVSAGQLSPDGRWVAYASKESGRDEVYVVPFDVVRILNSGPGSPDAGGGGSGRFRRAAAVAPGGERTARRSSTSRRRVN
ncbi:MAG: hypothetical protein DMG57_35565 [Acidobacteria bacterium]|nr:MAG: hypothetical protein DMG57_35565 [Acidobacteriota bacterium]